MRRYRYNFRVYHLVIFLRGKREPIDLVCYSIKEVLRILERWEADENFESAHLLINED